MAPKPPKGGSISPVPPPLQFANFENASAVNKFSSSAAISASSSSSYSAQSKFTSNVSSQRSGTGVKVNDSSKSGGNDRGKNSFYTIFEQFDI